LQYSHMAERERETDRENLSHISSYKDTNSTHEGATQRPHLSYHDLGDEGSKKQMAGEHKHSAPGNFTLSPETQTLYPSAPRYTVLSNATTKCLLSLNIILNP
jgi:hypothetical protein